MIPGIDIARWQRADKPIDFCKARDAGAKFVAIKASQNTFADKWFSESCGVSKDILPRAAYHFYDWRTTGKPPEEQAAFFNTTVGDQGELPPVLDFEEPYLGWSTTPFPSRSVCLDFIWRFWKSLGSSRMFLYCNSNALNQWRPIPNWMRDNLYLWIASYPTFRKGGVLHQASCPEEIPVGYEPQTYGWNWTMWQYTSKLDGKKFGVGSLDLDGDLCSDESLLGTSSEPSDREKLCILWDWYRASC